MNQGVEPDASRLHISLLVDLKKHPKVLLSNPFRSLGCIWNFLKLKHKKPVLFYFKKCSDLEFEVSVAFSFFLSIFLLSFFSLHTNLGSTMCLLYLTNTPRGNCVPYFYNSIFAGSNVKLALRRISHLIYCSPVVISRIWRNITDKGVDVVKPN